MLELNRTGSCQSNGTEDFDTSRRRGYRQALRGVCPETQRGGEFQRSVLNCQGPSDGGKSGRVKPIARQGQCRTSGTCSFPSNKSLQAQAQQREFEQLLRRHRRKQRRDRDDQQAPCESTCDLGSPPTAPSKAPRDLDIVPVQQADLSGDEPSPRGEYKVPSRYCLPTLGC